MYYGYNDERELVLADQEFIELLGFHSFKELRASDIMNNLKFENKKIVIQQDFQEITSDFLHYDMYGEYEEFYLVELKNIQIEKSTNTTVPTQKLENHYQEIYLDVNKISEQIGLSVKDYKLYLDSFIDQSIIDEERLLEGNDKVVKNLSNLALTLKIPHINILLLKIKKLSAPERMPLIDEYYTKLALLTLEKPENYEDTPVKNIFEKDEHQVTNTKEDVLNARFSDLLKNVDEKVTVEEEPSFNEKLILDKEITTPEQESKEFNLDETPKVVQQELFKNSEMPKISLDNVPELPISYDPQTAADELNLPAVLIEEFVDDFIEQARQDKDHLLTSYYQKDMENIHELGHKLKGAASNLRINELSDILEEIQFCTEYEKLEGLFVKYWGHFLSLERYMKNLNRG